MSHRPSDPNLTFLAGLATGLATALIGWSTAWALGAPQPAAWGLSWAMPLVALLGASLAVLLYGRRGFQPLQ